jgi:hypothetical protein
VRAAIVERLGLVGQLRVEVVPSHDDVIVARAVCELLDRGREPEDVERGGAE